MLVRVFEVPPPVPNLVFQPAAFTFRCVDWFRDDDLPPGVDWQALITGFLAGKRYNYGQALLVMGGDGRAFTLNYEAP